MKYLAPSVWRLKELPRPLINVYLAGDVLIDAGRRWDKRRIFAELEGREISMVALTHVHPDHQGCAKAICEARGVPLACHADDVDAMEGRRPVAATSNPGAKAFARMWEGPPHRVDRVLREGDEVAGFRVIHLPGHAPGLIGLWRESDRLALASDCFYTLDPQTGLFGPPRVPHRAFNHDTEQARASIRKLAALAPATAWAGHAEPLRGDVAAQLEQAAATT